MVSFKAHILGEHYCEKDIAIKNKYIKNKNITEQRNSLQ